MAAMEWRAGPLPGAARRAAPRDKEPAIERQSSALGEPSVAAHACLPKEDWLKARGIDAQS